jgi:hypothetical protein
MKMKKNYRESICLNFDTSDVYACSSSTKKQNRTKHRNG